MKSKSALLSCTIGVFCLFSMTLNADIIFYDSFETNDLSTTNNEGFSWEAPNRTSVVIQDQEDGPVAVYNGSNIYNIHSPTMPDGSLRDWTSKTGSSALRFRYGAGTKWTEQRFNMGIPMPEIWIQFWIRVPHNFSYGPTGTPALNAKFFAIWMDEYEISGEGSTVWLGMNPVNTTDATLSYSYSQGSNTGSGGFQQTKPFVTTADRGRWMQIIFHVKAESSENSDDGVIQTYRRWEDESDFTQLHEDLNAPLRVPQSPTGFVKGYILGWVNAPYENDTEWLLDDFTISDQSLLTVKAPAPTPPALQIIK